MIMFIDRRTVQWEDKNYFNFGDDILFYDLPNGCNKLSKNTSGNN